MFYWSHRLRHTILFLLPRSHIDQIALLCCKLSEVIISYVELKQFYDSTEAVQCISRSSSECSVTVKESTYLFWKFYRYTYKLDGVAPLITDPPPTSFTTLSKKKIKVKNKKIIIKKLHLTYGGRWTFSQNFSCLALTVWEWRCLKIFPQRITYWVN